MYSQQVLEKLDNLVIHCPHYSQASELMEALSAIGFTWADGQSLLIGNYYNKYREATCYFLDVIISSGSVQYAHAVFFEEKGFKIISFDEFKKLIKDFKFVSFEEFNKLIKEESK